MPRKNSETTTPRKPRARKKKGTAPPTPPPIVTGPIVDADIIFDDGDVMEEETPPVPSQALVNLALRHQHAARQAARPGRERRWETEWVSLTVLRPADYNPRLMPVEEDESLGASLNTFGQLEPLVINTFPGREGIIVGGHQRLRRMLHDGWDEGQVVWTYLNRTEEKQANLALNRIHGEWDIEKLSLVLEDIRDDEGDLTLTGFTEEELDQLFGGGEDGEPDLDDDDFDEMPPHPGPTICQPGDVWALGRHRLAIGDATESATWEALLMGETAALTFTSPPYNVGKSSTRLSLNKNTGDSKYLNGESDERDTDEYTQLLCGFTREALAHSQYVMTNLQPIAGNKVALVTWQYLFIEHWADVIVWNKGTAQPAMDKRVLNAQFEHIYVFASGKPWPNRAIGTNPFHGTIANVYDGPPQRDKEFAGVHAATFPVHLPGWVIQSFTQPADIVVDCFAGTGTTMVAAERLGRSARLIELSPLYGDTILRRAKESLGIEPVLLVRDGEPVTGAREIVAHAS